MVDKNILRAVQNDNLHEWSHDSLDQMLVEFFVRDICRHLHVFLMSGESFLPPGLPVTP